MSTLLDRLPRGSRVLIVRLRSLGDCVLTTPAIHLLKQHRPDLRLTVMVEPRFAGVYSGNPDIDVILPPGLRAARRARPALALNLHGGSRSVWLTLASRARWRAGFAHYKLGWAHNVKLPRAQAVLGEERVVHTAEHVASAVFHLGVPRCEIPRARLFTKAHGAAGAVAVIHPLASAGGKTWPSANFTALAFTLRDRYGLEPVFLGGPGEDPTPYAPFCTLFGAPLEVVKQVLAAAQLFVGNDSGPAHMAAAFGLPVVVLFGPSNPLIWAPWRTRAEVIAGGAQLKDVPLDTVLDAVARLRSAA